MYRVLVSRTFLKQYGSLSKEMQKRIRKGLEEHKQDPSRSRYGADIKQLKDTDPPKHRMRIGEYRIIYRIEEKTVRLIELFTRNRGYRE